jgi:hypothetical protein
MASDIKDTSAVHAERMKTETPLSLTSVLQRLKF